MARDWDGLSLVPVLLFDANRYANCHITGVEHEQGRT